VEPESGVGARLLAVEDGDTAIFELAGARTPVRLLGINAPERAECMYEEATAGLEEALEGREIVVDARGQDQFGRTLAYLWADERSVNLDQVDAGLAIATTPEPSDDLGDDLLRAEEAAYESGIGLWDACDAVESGGLELEIDTSRHDPPGGDEEQLEVEKVTITNLGTTTVDLDGWVLRDESSAHRYRFSPGAELGPGDALEVASSEEGWDPGDSPVWNNAGDMALLLDSDGGVVARSRYRSP
jgi:hypothetical protein